MHIKLITVGTRMPAWVTTGFLEYSKRLPKNCSLCLCEIPLGRRSPHMDSAQLQKKEGQKMLAAVGKGDLLIALEVTGRRWSTQDLATQLNGWLLSGKNVSLFVGGPEGMLPEVSQQADKTWSLSPLTLPHPMIRIIIAEQIYRAWSILNHHPYHK